MKKHQLAAVLFVVMAYTAIFNIDGWSQNKVKADTGKVSLIVVNGCWSG